MKKSIKLIINVIVITSLSFFGSCVKDGDPGPKGDTGAQGEKGEQGQQGADGNANVSSNLYSVFPGSWFYNGSFYSTSVFDADITNANTDLVMTYVQGSTGDWFAMPISNFWSFGDNVAFSYHNNSVTFYYMYSSGPPVTWQFKIVVVPQRLAQQDHETDWRNYTAVKNKYNLKD